MTLPPETGPSRMFGQTDQEEGQAQRAGRAVQVWSPMPDAGTNIHIGTINGGSWAVQVVFP